MHKRLLLCIALCQLLPAVFVFHSQKSAKRTRKVDKFCGDSNNSILVGKRQCSVVDIWSQHTIQFTVLKLRTIQLTTSNTVITHKWVYTTRAYDNVRTPDKIRSNCIDV